MNKRFTALMTTLLLSVFFSISASAYDVEVDGIYYDISGRTATVKSGYSYSGDIVIPESITYNGSKYSVTSIGDWAFYYCSGLTSVTIPNSVTSIGNNAFERCSGLTSVTIPNSVTSIGKSAFYGCSGLTSVTIPNSVTSIGSGAFRGCSGITQAIIVNDMFVYLPIGYEGHYSIPENISTIIGEAFRDCSGLTSVTIPNSVTSIGEYAFYECSGLTSVTIPNSVTSIGKTAFCGCSGLTSVTIPNSVISIGESAFLVCSGLTSVTIPNSVTSIGNYAFKSCSKLENVYCYAEKIPDLGYNIFSGSYIKFATLHVPSSALSYYQTKSPWSGFGTIKALEGTEKKCETPTISYVDGKLLFSCATEGAKCYYTLNCQDVKSGETKVDDNAVRLSAYYDITCYAKAEGYANSDVATAKLYWLTSSGSLEGAGINNVSMRGIAIQSAGGFINISGLDNNETVSFYGTDGKALGSATAISGTATFATQSGSVVIAKIGKESVKIAVE